MEGSSSAPRLLNLFPLHPSSPGSSSSSSSSSPIQNASMVTPQESELPAKDNVAMAPPLLNLFPLHPSSPGSSSSSSSSPIQNASMVTPQEHELPAKDNVATALPLLNLFPLRPSGPGSASSSSPIKNANVATPQEGEIPGKGPKRKRSSGVSTASVLCDPWKIKKTLRESDLTGLSRLILPLGLLETYVFPFMGKEKVTQVQSKEGMNVVVVDEDRREEHQLVFRRWESSGSYVLNNGWTKQFVKKRGLKVGDEIGMLWDKVNHKFHFKVLPKVSRGTGNAAA